MFWLTGVLLFQSRYVAGQYRLLKLIRSSTLATDSTVSHVRTAIKSRLNISQHIEIMISDNLQTPLATGFFRHRILLPSAYKKWNREHLEYVLLHESAHIKRRDMLTQFIVHLITSLFWYNPAVWLAQKQFVIEREHACDDLVLMHSKNPQHYADMLLEFAQKSLTLPRVAYAGLSMARSSQLEGRLLSILQNNRRASKFNMLSTTLAAIVVIFSILCLSPFAVGDEQTKIDTTHTALVIESLKYALNDEDGDVREEAMRTLGKINSPKSTALLSQVLQQTDNDWEVEFNAAKILLQRGETKALDKFITGLSDQETKVRLRSAKMLRELKHPSSLEPLIKAMDDANEDVREQVVRALSELRIDAALAPLREAAQDEDVDIRRIAVWGLGEINNPQALKFLYKALDDLDAKVRCNAVESIGDLKQSESAVFIAPLLNDREWFVRRETIRVMAELQTTEFVPGIITALQDDNRKVRQAAAEALGQLGDRRAIVPLSAALHDKSDNVREQAADALGEFYKEK
jgi:HEAT repeat protein